MFVRKRKAARKKRKQIEDRAEPSMPEEYAGEEEGDADVDRDSPSYAEHQFTFAAFETVR